MGAALENSPGEKAGEKGLAISGVRKDGKSL